ncbi:MAG: hypothetical protein ACRDRV_04935 [Pseudonocardiaceae bacterium]
MVKSERPIVGIHEFARQVHPDIPTTLIDDLVATIDEADGPEKLTSDPGVVVLPGAAGEEVGDPFIQVA